MAKKRKMDYYDRQRYIAFACLGACLVAVAGLIAYAFYEGAQWQAFAQENDCKVIAKNAGSAGYGIMANGKMGMVFIDGSTTYHCNDGVDYTR